MVQVVNLDTRERCEHGRLQNSFWGFQKQHAQLGRVAKADCCTDHTCRTDAAEFSEGSPPRRYRLIFDGFREILRILHGNSQSNDSVWLMATL